MIATLTESTENPPRKTRRSVSRSPRSPDAPVPKSKDASMTKSSFYLPVEVSKKLAVAALIRGVDQSTLVAQVLGREFSSVTYYERPATRPADEPLTSRSSTEAVSVK